MNSSRASAQGADASRRHALVLVSCVKQKKAQAAPASELYTSSLFTGCRAFAERHASEWFILSAKHGLVAPATRLEPYELTLTRMSKAVRQEWATGVLNELLPIARDYPSVTLLAGSMYREFLLGPLQDRGISVAIPMQGLTLGRQLKWLKEQNRIARAGCR